MSWGPSNLNFDFTHLVVLTHVADDPNVYILNREDIQNSIKSQAGRYWIDPDNYRVKGKYWDEI